ncbi:divergent AAA domain protein [Selenomonas sp. FOBRC6]|nr:divergent AAA domain protein [Selenomonas sp. FOBRC6]
MSTNHEEKIRQIILTHINVGRIKSRESTTLEFKESFNMRNVAMYAKIMASYANNCGGYIIFGVKDRPRNLVGLSNDKFDNLDQAKFTEAINALFAPALEWECGMLQVEIAERDKAGELGSVQKKIGWIYTVEAEQKPVVAQKENEGEKITSGDVFYRYRARTQKIRYAEMAMIIESRIVKEWKRMFRLLEVIRKSETANIGIVNYTNGRVTTPYGIDVELDRKLVAKVLRRAKFIKEGVFNEIEGAPVIKVTGNIDLAEEVPVPEGDPDITHPYIQKQLAEKLDINVQVLYALIWYYKMKGEKKYHLEITTSKSGAVHKFSEFSFRYLQDQLKKFRETPKVLDKILDEYKSYKRKMIKS